jgi:DnaJ-class molecular chaperone
MRKSIIKYCRTCEGKGKLISTLNIDGEHVDTTLICPHCKGKGHHVWGYMTDEDLGEPWKYYEGKDVENA